ncbi:MAG: radical SAM protein, partial [bacterium]|nr:radical SAM protein [bacterium]
FSDELVQIFRETPTLCKYLDIPFQHISNKVLKSMHRGSDSKYIWSIIERLREAVPTMAIRSTFITGYPGETDEDFKQLEDFIRQAELERVGVFPFSIEEGTEAATLPHLVPKKVAEERRDVIMKLQQKISLKKNRQLIGKQLKAIREKSHGRLESQAPEIDGIVKLKNSRGGPMWPPNKEGQPHRVAPTPFIAVKITDAEPYDLVGQIV